ncbi:MAG TPA: formylglycine-generating enzyme family protein [Cytophagaceae bacterium]|jgi:sulfatase modifying factor 1
MNSINLPPRNLPKLLIFGFVTLIVLAIVLSAFKNLELDKSKADEKTAANQKLNIPKEMVFVEGGTYQNAEKTPEVKQLIKPFAIDRNLVTVDDFIKFVNVTQYKTEAERFGNAAVFDFDKQEWLLVDGASFLYPQGIDKAPAQLDHPVTQISWNDAQAYAKWRGKRLPTSIEWEWAAQSGGKSKNVYAWGNEIKKAGKILANHWQGEFPIKNTKEDGYLTTSPVGAFGANPIGLTDMGGNVWQWCADSILPTANEAQMDPSIRKVTKGGSFLCDPKVCHGFRVTGAASSTPETALFHTGFRCVTDIEDK